MECSISEEERTKQRGRSLVKIKPGKTTEARLPNEASREKKTLCWGKITTFYYIAPRGAGGNYADQEAKLGRKNAFDGSTMGVLARELWRN